MKKSDDLKMVLETGELNGEAAHQTNLDAGMCWSPQYSAEAYASRTPSAHCSHGVARRISRSTSEPLSSTPA